MKRIAIVELDIRGCRMVVAEYNDNALVNVLDEMDEPLKLWADIDVDNVIKPARTLETIGILQNFQRYVTLYKVESTVAYCTGALKEVKNHRSFIEELNSETVFKFDIMNEDKLETAVHLLNANTMEQVKGIVINVQDEYINIVKYNRRNIIDSCKFNFGTLTLAKAFENEDKMNPARKMEKMVDFAKKQFAKNDIVSGEDEEYKIIGMGNAFVNVGRLTRMSIKYPLNLDHNYELTIEDFPKAYNVVKNMDVDKTKKIKGVSSERADMVASGFAIVKALMDVYFVNIFAINELSIATGVLYSEMNNIFGDRPIGDILTQSLETCNVFYDNIENDNKYVYIYANDLFEELRVLHRYNKSQQKVLKIASYLASCGRRINSRNFERTGFPIVVNSEIYGASHKELVLAGFVCASQSLDDFDFSNWVRYKDLIDEEDLDIVKKLAVIVKISRLIDKSKTADHIVCDVLGDKCILNVVPKADCSCVLEDVKKAGTDFKRAFNKQLQVL